MIHYHANSMPFLDRRRSAVSGFTLMEVLISMAVIAISLTAVYHLHSQTVSMTHRSEFYTVAPLLAHQKMVELQLKPGDELLDDAGDFGENHPDFSWQASVADVASELLTHTREDLKQVDVTIYHDGDQLVFSLRRYLFLRNE